MTEPERINQPFTHAFHPQPRAEQKSFEAFEYISGSQLCELISPEEAFQLVEEVLLSNFLPQHDVPRTSFQVADGQMLNT